MNLIERLRARVYVCVCGGGICEYTHACVPQNQYMHLNAPFKYTHIWTEYWA